MIDQLFNFYKEELTIKNYIFSDAKNIYEVLKYFPSAFIILAIILFSVLSLLFPTKNFSIVMVVYVVVFVILTFIMSNELNDKGKEKVKELCDGMKSNKSSWRSIKIDNKIRQNVKTELENKIKEYDNNFDPTTDSKYVKELSGLVRKRADEIKYDFIPKISAIGVVLIPLWASFTTWIFDKVVPDPTTGIWLFLSINIFIFIIYIYFEAVRIIFKNYFTKDDDFKMRGYFINGDYIKMKELESLLYEIYLDLKIRK